MFIIGLLAKAGQLSRKLKLSLNSNPKFQVELFSDAKSLVKEMNYSNLTAVVILEEQLVERHADLTKSLALQMDHMPLILTAPNIRQDLRLQMSLMDDVPATVIDIFHEFKDINSIIEKAAQGIKLPSRGYCRFAVNKAVLISPTSTTLFRRARILSLSFGGAMVQLTAGDQIDSEEICLKISDQSGTERTIFGKIVWRKMKLSKSVSNSSATKP